MLRLTLINIEDYPHLKKENWPIWYKGGTPIGCSNEDLSNSNPFDTNIIKERREYYNNSIAVCDDSGVVIIKDRYIDIIF